MTEDSMSVAKERELDQRFPIAGSFKVLVFPEDLEHRRTEGRLSWRYGRIPKDASIEGNEILREDNIDAVMEFRLDSKYVSSHIIVTAISVFGDGSMKINEHLPALARGDTDAEKILTDAFSENYYGITIAPFALTADDLILGDS